MASTEVKDEPREEGQLELGTVNRQLIVNGTLGEFGLMEPYDLFNGLLETGDLIAEIGGLNVEESWANLEGPLLAPEDVVINFIEDKSSILPVSRGEEKLHIKREKRICLSLSSSKSAFRRLTAITMWIAVEGRAHHDKKIVMNDNVSPCFEVGSSVASIVHEHSRVTVNSTQFDMMSDEERGKRVVEIPVQFGMTTYDANKFAGVPTNKPWVVKMQLDFGEGVLLVVSSEPFKVTAELRKQLKRPWIKKEEQVELNAGFNPTTDKRLKPMVDDLKRSLREATDRLIDQALQRWLPVMVGNVEALHDNQIAE